LTYKTSLSEGQTTTLEVDYSYDKAVYILVQTIIPDFNYYEIEVNGIDNSFSKLIIVLIVISSVFSIWGLILFITGSSLTVFKFYKKWQKKENKNLFIFNGSPDLNLSKRFEEMTKNPVSIQKLSLDNNSSKTIIPKDGFENLEKVAITNKPVYSENFHIMKIINQTNNPISDKIVNKQKIKKALYK